jgi:putative phosphoesterase
MRLAVISDIHGNTLALQAVLDRLAAEPVDRVICLGDLAVNGFDPAGAIDRIDDLGCPVIRGNTDDFLIHGYPEASFAQGDADIRRELAAWTLNQITPRHRAFLETLVPFAEIELDGVAICASHGSPLSYNDPVLPDTPAEELNRSFAGTDAPVLVNGHTHRQMLRRWNGRTIINPGPVSLTFERLPVERDRTCPWTEYAIITSDRGAIDVSFRYLPLDLDALATAARQSGMPHADWWLNSNWGIGAD